MPLHLLPPLPSWPALRRAGLLLTLVGGAVAGSLPPKPVEPQDVTLPQLGPTKLGTAKAPPGGLSAAVRTELDAVMGSARGVRVGVVVLDAPGGAVLYARRPDVPITPASNMKLLSLGAALVTLGPGYWFSTSVTRPAGEVGARAAHLTLVGGGDPSLERQAGGHSLAALARQVYGSGVRQVGALHLDARLIGAPPGSGLAGWGVPVAERAVSGLTLHDPAAGEGAAMSTPPDAGAALMQLGAAFRAELTRAGVQVTGGLVIVPPRDPLRPTPEAEDGVATTRSAPLAALVTRTMKRSDNVWAEQLYARVGVNSGTPHWRPASPAYARAREDELLRQAGVSAAALVRQDGSGLSAGDRLTPRAVAQLLRYLYLHPVGAAGMDPRSAFVQRRNVFIEALPRAGTGTRTPAAAELGGTLASRLAGLDVRAKTGTLPGVSALSGYVRTRGGRVLVFSVLMDRASGPTAGLRAVQDRLLRVLADE